MCADAPLRFDVQLVRATSVHDRSACLCLTLLDAGPAPLGVLKL